MPMCSPPASPTSCATPPTCEATPTGGHRTHPGRAPGRPAPPAQPSPGLLRSARAAARPAPPPRPRPDAGTSAPRRRAWRTTGRRRIRWCCRWTRPPRSRPATACPHLAMRAGTKGQRLLCDWPSYACGATAVGPPNSPSRTLLAALYLLPSPFALLLNNALSLPHTCIYILYCCFFALSVC